MNKLLKVSLVSLVLGSTSSAFAGGIAMLNSAYVFQNHPDRVAISKILDDEFKAESDKLKAEENQIVKKIQTLEKDAPRLRAADIKKREDGINKERALFEKKANTFQAKLNARENQETEKMLASIQVAADKIAKAKDYDLVVDSNSVVYIKAGNNISDEVLRTIVPSYPAPKTTKKEAKK